MRTMKEFNSHIFEKVGISSTLWQETNHTPPRIEHTASDTLTLVAVPVSPLLHESCAEMHNVHAGIYDNLCDGNTPFPG